jgi:YVTN family beta-propeller protein
MNAWLAAGLGVLLVGSLLFHAAGADAATLLTPSRSTTIALTEDNRLLVVVNRETHSLSVFRVRNLLGQELDPPVKLAEIAVGIEPRCVALHPSGNEAYVTNGVSGTVSVVDLSGLNRFQVVAEIPVGTEPRGCAITPNGGALRGQPYGRHRRVDRHRLAHVSWRPLHRGESDGDRDQQ